MQESYDSAGIEIRNVLEARGYQVSDRALTPLKQIDFDKLQAIHDHEEAFIRKTMIDSILRAYEFRIGGGAKTEPITSRDIKMGMMIFGTAAGYAPEQSLEVNSKKLIIESCPYCGSGR
jgi:hypothetical protein